MKSHDTITFETVERELKIALKLILDRAQMARADQARAVEAKNYAGAGTYDGQIIGLMQAETILRDSIKENEARIRYSMTVDANIEKGLAALTHIDPRRCSWRTPPREVADSFRAAHSVVSRLRT